MFKIVDGREYFYQWDLDRQITVEDSSITEVHFCNRTDDCSLVVDVTDGIANVPNIILTNSFDVRVFGYDGKATLHEKTFKVKPRTKPADYVYVETEARKFDELMAKAEEAVTYANEICEYVENNKLDFVDDGEGNVELKAINPEGGESADVDLSNYYTKEETDTRIEEAIEGIEIPDVPEVDLSDYAKKSDIPTVPTNVSAFTNDAGYLTEHQSLEEYAKKSDIPDTSAFISAIPAEYVTETELNEALANIEIVSPDGTVQSTLYEHHIAIASINGENNNRNANNAINVVITNKDNTPFTPATLKDFLVAGGHTSVDSYYPASGGVIDRYRFSTITIDENAVCEAFGIIANGDNLNAIYVEPLNDASTSKPKGGLLTDLVYATNKGERYDSFYQSFKDTIVSYTVTTAAGEDVDMSEYAKLTDIPDVSEYQTEAQVNALINQALGVIENGSY